VYVPVDGDTADPLEGVDADAVVLPGTKNTVDDLLALHDAGFADALAAFEGPIVGVCGGYQLLGERITNAALEGTGEADVVEGLGLLPVETRFEGDKRLEQTTVPVDGDASPLLEGATGPASGYEIHAGRTRALEDVTRPLGDSSAARGGCWEPTCTACSTTRRSERRFSTPSRRVRGSTGTPRTRQGRGGTRRDARRPGGAAGS